MFGNNVFSVFNSNNNSFYMGLLYLFFLIILFIFFLFCEIWLSYEKKNKITNYTSNYFYTFLIICLGILCYFITVLLSNITKTCLT
jgi:hypothetical protein